MGAVLSNHRTGESQWGHGETPEEWGGFGRTGVNPGAGVAVRLRFRSSDSLLRRRVPGTE